MYHNVERREEDHQQECVVRFGNVGDVVEDDQSFDLSGDEQCCADEADLPGNGSESACRG